MPAAGCPVVVETPGCTEGQTADIQWLRERVAGRDRPDPAIRHRSAALW